MKSGTVTRFVPTRDHRQNMQGRSQPNACWYACRNTPKSVRIPVKVVAHILPDAVKAPGPAQRYS
eukprot:6198937-Pleurochrysis_carterae.AAC.3